MATPAKLTVRYHHERPGLCSGNIIWSQRDRGSEYYRVSQYGMNGGKFPADHPAAPSSCYTNLRMEMGDSEALRNFRARGYWASCFPEGDGITMTCERGQDPTQVIQDIAECFGWNVRRAA